MALMRVRTVFTGVAGTPWYLNLHFEGGTAAFQDAIDHVIAFMTDVDDYMHPDVDYVVEGDVTFLDVATGEVIGVASGTGGSGSGHNSGDMIPRSSQAMLRLRTGIYAGGRQIQGRILLPGFVESTNASNGGIDIPTIDALAVSAFDNLVDAGSPVLVVWSRTNDQDPVVQQIVGWAEWAVLRSRRD